MEHDGPREGLETEKPKQWPILAPDQELKEAQLVAILLHGVGDHTAVDILSELFNGLDECERRNDTVARVRLKDFPLPNGRSGLQNAARITSAQHNSLIIPVVWSRLRPRAAQHLPELHGSSSSSVPFLDVLFYLLASIPALFKIVVNSFRCVPKARGFWKAVMLLTACSVLAGISAFVWAVLEIVVHRAPVFIQVLNSEIDFTNIWILVILMLTGVALLVFLQESLPVLDFVGDVAAYVGVPRYRARAEARMAAIVQYVLTSAPGAHLLVVGHSLGSILITHSVLAAENWNLDSRQLTLLTLGSPLKILSRAFAGRILSAEQLATRYSQDGTVSLWVNAWRSRDIIGKSLATSVSSKFRERCLGPGGHTNYWSDARLWHEVLSLLNSKQ